MWYCACALLAAKSNFLSAFLKLCALLTPNYLASRLPLYGTSTDLPRLKGAAFPIRPRMSPIMKPPPTRPDWRKHFLAEHAMHGRKYSPIVMAASHRFFPWPRHHRIPISPRVRLLLPHMVLCNQRPHRASLVRHRPLARHRHCVVNMAQKSWLNSAFRRRRSTPWWPQYHRDDLRLTMGNRPQRTRTR